jgi:ribonuclease HI
VKYKIFADGASSGNPGPSGYGYIILDENDNTVESSSKFIGEGTNNIAEYLALYNALKKVALLKPDSIEIFLDSELIVKQIKGEYRVKNERLGEIYREVVKILNKFPYKISHIPREQNKIADKLAKNAILDKQ